MTDAHRQAFVAESQEGITNLNNSLLALEADPDDDEAMDDIFRTAHTFKGNAAAMGYDDISELAHALEDLLDAVRDGGTAVTPELMDLLFEGVDLLEAMVDEVAAEGEATTDPGDAEERLREAIESGVGGDGDDERGATDSDDSEMLDEAESDEAGASDDNPGSGEDSESATPAPVEAAEESDGESDEQTGVVEGGEETGIVEGDQAAGGESDEQTGVVDGDQEAGEESEPDCSVPPESELPDRVRSLGTDIVRAQVDLGNPEMPGIDATFVLEAASDSWDALSTVPEWDAVEDGEFDDGFDIYVGDSDPTGVEEGLSAVSQVESVAVAAGSGDAAAADPATNGSESARQATASGASGESGAAANGATADGESERPDTATGGGGSAAGEGSGRDEAASPDGPGAGGAESVNDDAADGVEDAADDVEDAADDGEDTAGTGSGDQITSVRVNMNQLDELYGQVEQLVTARIKLRREMEDAGVESDNLDELDKITSNLQGTVMDMRLIPLKKVVDKFPRLVRDIARDLDKRVDFEMEGTDIELDRTILTEIRDPLVHVLRNAVDHGIESPEEREAAGKDRVGTVRLTASRKRDHVTVVVEDDGDGLDADRLRAKAVDEGVMSEAEAADLDEAAAHDLVFHPGLSTTDEVTDVSGRGVGMDVVRTTVEQLDGSVSVDSEPGEGTRVELRLPVTVAIVKVMFVRVGGAEYGVPVKNIAEITRTDDIRVVNGDEVVEHEDELYPVIGLDERLHGGAVADGGATADGGAAAGGADAGSDGRAAGVGGNSGEMLVRIRSGERPVALRCDAVVGQEEVVVKPLEGVLSGVPGLSGTAVLGDGDVVPILDVVSL